MSEDLPPFYRRARGWLEHRRSTWVLYGASFVESIFSPLPPDFLLAPMVVVRPHKAWQFAFWTMIASVAGAVGGYLIGAYFMEVFGNDLVAFYGLTNGMERFSSWLRQYGAVIILICALSPIPYKAVALTSGAALIDPLTFIVMGLIGRGARFFAVAALCKKWGAAAEAFLLKKIVGSKERDLLGLVFLACCAVLGGAFFMEYALSLAPCRLCLWQRIPYYIVLGLSFVGLMFFLQKFYREILLLSASVFFVGGVLAGFHWGVEFGFWAGLDECSGGGFATDPKALLDQLQQAGPADCATPQWTFAGISLAGYNMFISFGLTAFILWKLYGKPR